MTHQDYPLARLRCSEIGSVVEVETDCIPVPFRRLKMNAKLTWKLVLT